MPTLRFTYIYMHEDEQREIEKEKDLYGAVEDTAEANTVLEDLVDLHNGAVRLVRSTIRHIVYVQHHLRHLLHRKKETYPNPIQIRNRTLSFSTSPLSL